MDENKSNKGLYFVPMNGCPLKMMEMKNEWGLLFEKRIRNACLSAIQTHNSGTLNF